VQFQNGYSVEVSRDRGCVQAIIELPARILRGVDQRAGAAICAGDAGAGRVAAGLVAGPGPNNRSVVTIAALPLRWWKPQCWRRAQGAET